MRRFVPAFAAAALLVVAGGCSGGLAPVEPNAGSPGLSWNLKDAAKHNLLYVSDEGAGTVYFYSYPWGKLEGTLTNLAGPSSVCADDAGHVWVVESQTSEIVEYDHGGSKPVATLQDPGYRPSDCAVNPKTGDLAVANVFEQYGSQGSPGNLVLYKKAAGKPQTLTTPDVINYMYVTYDSQGNLFVDGFAAYNDFALAELPAGASALTTIKVDQKISSGNTADVKWDGKYLAIGDSSVNALYQIAVRGTRGKRVGKTSLQSVTPGFLGHICFPKITRRTGEAARVIIPNNTTVGYWAYPSGGRMKRRIARLIFAGGAAVSKGP